jgi:uncharacterized protein (TIGR02145 family)
MRDRISLSKGFFPLLLSSLIILFLVGCAEDSRILDNGGNRQLEFSVKTCGWNNSNSSSDSKKDSRATPITGNTFDTSKSFNVIADVNKGGNWSMEINNETASYSTANNIWQTSKIHYWPGIASTVNFYAYYPTSISSSITHSLGSAPILSYTVPDNAGDQIDILASSKPSVAGNSYNQTSVDFKHIFAAVNFQVGSSGLPSGTISSITINGIKNSGIYTFGNGWTLNSGATTFKASPSIAINGTSGESITSGTYTLMMIPQIFNNATITLTYNTGTAYTQTISGAWSAGNSYTYNLSKPVNIGNYYYSDGTWGSIAEHANSTASPIGVIFSNSTSNTDKGHNWTHGYAMALQNAGSGTATYQWYTSDSGSPTGSSVITVDQIMSDKDGYTYSGYIQTSGYAAGIAARGYTAKDKNGNTVAIPSCSSGWYLPSSGQWYDICVNLGGMVAASGKAYTYSSTGWFRWYSGDTSGDTNNYPSLWALDLNSYMNTLKEKGYSVDLFSSNDEYWGSSEYDSSCASCVYSDGSASGEVGVSCSHKMYWHSVRSVIAF